MSNCKMSDIKRLVFSIIQFLDDQLSNTSLSADAVESLEVAIQCLQSAYGINQSVPDASLQISRPLLSIFTEAIKNEKFRAGWPRLPMGDDGGGSSQLNDGSDEDEDEEEDDDDDEEEEDEDDEQDALRVLNNNNTKGDSNGNSVSRDLRVVHPSSAQHHEILSPLDLSVVGKSMVSDEVDVCQVSPTNHTQSYQAVRQPHQLSLHAADQAQQQHNLVRMPPKGGCVQCGKEGRVTKRGRPHESYFGCRSCQVHLCRKRNCFQVFHSIQFGHWELT